jgi:pyruvate formate lyase activating enzyme
MKKGGTIRDIQRYSIHDGPGIRATVFFKGCPLKCAWCANPDTQESGIEIAVNPDLCIPECRRCLGVCHARALIKSSGGKISVNWAGCSKCADCSEECPSGAIIRIGRDVTVDEIVAQGKRDKLFYDSSGGGVTLSGGEPLAQPSFLLPLLGAFREEGIHVALDTSGFGAPDIFEKACLLTDLIFFDLKIIDPQEHLKWTGKSNAVILDNFRKMAGMGISFQVRFPLIPGITDTAKNLEEIALQVAQVGRSIDVLPYHRLGIRKYSMMGKQYSLDKLDVKPPSSEEIAYVVGYFARHNIIARVVT